MWFASQSPTILQFQLSSWQFSHIQTFTLVKEAPLIKLSFRAVMGQCRATQRWTNFWLNVFRIRFLIYFCRLETSFLLRNVCIKFEHFFLRLCMLEGNFSRFLLLHDKKKMYADFFHIFLLLCWKLFWFRCCCLVSSLVTWNAVCFFFGNWHQQSVVFSHRKVACYLHKQEI